LNFINSKKKFEDRLIYRFRQIVSGHSGLNIREQDSEKLSEAVSLRMKSLRLSSPNAYYQILEADSEKSKAEFREIAIHLTTGETYFFRDRGQFSLLKFSILPELIELRKDKRALRIWSAGCSTGEEAYSIAILMNELIKNPPIPPLVKGDEGGLGEWDILILGTDINEDALKKARRGYYRDWSFRMVSEDIKKQWFHRIKDEWRLDKNITQRVKFEVVDLNNDDYPDYKSILHDMDIILCRNVFIYFNPDVVFKVVSKLSATLNDGGYLITGHAELPQQAIANLRPRVFPESVVYQKGSELGVGSEESKLTLPLIPSHQGRGDIYTPSPLAGEGGGEGDISEARELFKKGNYPLTIEKLGHILQVNSRNFDAHYLMSKTYANMGEHDKSIYHCQQAIEIDKFNSEPYYLFAQIAREKGRLEEEEEMLKQRVDELERFNKLMIGRELKMEELTKANQKLWARIEELEKK
jgi:chemotaxis protein methyltransferase CheR